jgi:hypothetical protein
MQTSLIKHASIIEMYHIWAGMVRRYNAVFEAYSQQWALLMGMRSVCTMALPSADAASQANHWHVHVIEDIADGMLSHFWSYFHLHGGA